MTDIEKTVKQLKELVDDTADKIAAGELSPAEADDLIRSTRDKAQVLIPKDMDKYDLIYQSRFERLIEQFITKKDID